MRTKINQNINTNYIKHTMKLYKTHNEVPMFKIRQVSLGGDSDRQLLCKLVYIVHMTLISTVNMTPQT